MIFFGQLLKNISKKVSQKIWSIQKKAVLLHPKCRNYLKKLEIMEVEKSSIGVVGRDLMGNPYNIKYPPMIAKYGAVLNYANPNAKMR